MRKAISLILGVLCIFFNLGSAKAHEIMLFPGGEKKITYSYSELQHLRGQHREVLEKIRSSIRFKEKMKIPLVMVAALCIVVGVILCVIGTKNIGCQIGGVGACILGAFNLGIAVGGSTRGVVNLREQAFGVNSGIAEIESSMRCIDALTMNGLSGEEAAKNFYLALHIDDKGFVYQVEFGGAHLRHTLLPLERKYKINW